MTTKRSHSAELFGADTRSLAALRVGLGALVLIHALLRLRLAEVFYSDEGVLPCSTLDLSSSLSAVFRLYCSVDASWHAAILLLTAVSGLGLMLGFFSRLCSVAAWYLMICLQVRNPLAIQGGDLLLRTMLFWGMFLPLGRQWSIDALRSPTRLDARGSSVLNVGTVAFSIQIAFVYLFTVALKLQGETWSDGTALYYALNIDQLVTPLGRSLLHHPALLSTLVPFVLAAEGLGALLLFVPWKTWVFRSTALAGFFFMHASFLACLNLGPFPWTNMISFVFFVPKKIWDLLLQPGRDTIYADDRRQPAASGVMGTIWQLIAALYLAAVVQWNLATLERVDSMSPAVDVLVSSARLDQNWDMFAPNPQKDDGWYIFAGTFADGTQADIFPGLLDSRTKRALTESRPADLSLRYSGERWRKYLMNLWTLQDYEKFRLLAQYVCRSWNAVPDRTDRLNEVEIIYMLERTPPPGQIISVEKVSVIRHACNGVH